MTGWGLVTPLGHSAWSTFRALLEGHTLAERAAGLLDSGGLPEPVALVRAVGCVSHVQHAAVDPVVALAEHAAREALTQARIGPGDLAGVPVFLGVSKGAVQALSGACAAWHETRARPRPGSGAAGAAGTVAPWRAGACGPVGYLAEELTRRLGSACVRPVVAACASGLTAVHLARLAIAQGSIDRALVVSAEASLTPLFVHSYQRLGVLPRLTPGEYVGRPLDCARRGFMLAEQGAAVVLERERRGGGRGGAAGGGAAAELLDSAIAAEGHDLMQPAPGMPALRHIAARLLVGRDIDVLHPHATGTADNDEAELAVYEGLRGGEGLGTPGGAAGAAAGPLAGVHVYACKGALGHSLGAAGLVSLVIACLCARTGRVPPMPWLTDPVPSRLPLSPRAASLAGPSRQAVFAAGFGGHVAGAVVGATERP